MKDFINTGKTSLLLKFPFPPSRTKCPADASAQPRAALPDKQCIHPVTAWARGAKVILSMWERACLSSLCLLVFPNTQNQSYCEVTVTYTPFISPCDMIAERKVLGHCYAWIQWWRSLLQDTWCYYLPSHLIETYGKDNDNFMLWPPFLLKKKKQYL